MSEEDSKSCFFGQICPGRAHAIMGGKVQNSAREQFSIVINMQKKPNGKDARKNRRNTDLTTISETSNASVAEWQTQWTQTKLECLCGKPPM
jgi:hypothetical protein